MAMSNARKKARNGCAVSLLLLLALLLSCGGVLVLLTDERQMPSGYIGHPAHTIVRMFGVFGIVIECLLTILGALKSRFWKGENLWLATRPYLGAGSLCAFFVTLLCSLPQIIGLGDENIEPLNTILSAGSFMTFHGILIVICLILPLSKTKQN